MAGVTSWALLALLLFGLRLGGQGMLGHLALTAIPRWFKIDRGRALGIAMLGFPAGEALLPIIVAFLLTLIAWREIWVGLAVSVFVVLVPLMAWLGREAERRGLNGLQLSGGAANSTQELSWTRAQVLRDRRFIALLPGLLAPPFIMTGVLFHQVHLVEVKGWALTEFGACYLLYASSATAVSLGLRNVCGPLSHVHVAARLPPPTRARTCCSRRDTIDLRRRGVYGAHGRNSWRCNDCARCFVGRNIWNGSSGCHPFRSYCPDRCCYGDRARGYGMASRSGSGLRLAIGRDGRIYVGLRVLVCAAAANPNQQMRLS